MNNPIEKINKFATVTTVASLKIGDIIYDEKDTTAYLVQDITRPYGNKFVRLGKEVTSPCFEESKEIFKFPNKEKAKAFATEVLKPYFDELKLERLSSFENLKAKALKIIGLEQDNYESRTYDDRQNKGCDSLGEELLELVKTAISRKKEIPEQCIKALKLCGLVDEIS